MYHRVAEVPCDPWGLCVTPRHFDEQLQVLRQHGEIISAAALGDALKSGRLPRRAFVLTFDDGYADNLLAAKPLLVKHDAPATLFLCTGALDSIFEFWWDAVERIFLHPGTLPENLELQIDGNLCK
jgi:peptidoglycan/xylan/chitin deacetylase (PgdA/CDA1 family)